MSQEAVRLFIVEDHEDLAEVLVEAANLHNCHAVCASSLAGAREALATGPFDVALVDLALGGDSGFDVLRLIGDAYPATSCIVVSGSSSITSAIQSFELSAFAYVQKPVDITALFTTVHRAAEHGRMAARNRRLLWELQTINDIADGIAHSLQVDDVLAGALQRLAGAMTLSGGAVRLRDDATGAYELAGVVGSPAIRGVWTANGGRVPRPSDTVIATRRAVVIDDLADLVPARDAEALPVRSAVSVPMIVGDELVGTITVCHGEPGRFAVADQRLLTTIAGQIGVAVQNARLHGRVQRGKQEWEQTFDAIGDPIAVFDARGALLRGNSALAAHIGRAVTELPGGFTCGDLGFCGGGCPMCAVCRAVSEGTQVEVTRPDGQIFSVTTFPVGGGPDGAAVVQVAKNVTEDIANARRLRRLSEELASANRRSMASLVQLKATQAQLLQADKLSAIGQLVAGVAHELNNPLTSVIGYAQLLEEEILGSPGGVQDIPALAQDMRRIADESERAARIVRNLLAFARRQSAARALHDVSDVFEKTLALREYSLRSSGIILEKAFTAALPGVMADSHQLQQALLNLVLNAEQAMRGRAVRRLHVGSRFDEAAGAVELFVADTGHGIEDANLSRIFDPFFTTRDVGEGTGLGLSICYGIVRDHGGQIVVESAVDAGTTFSIFLPARLPDAERSAEVLVALAEGGDRDVFAAALDAWGYRVVAAVTATDAHERYARGGLHSLVLDAALVAADPQGWRAAREADPSRTPLILIGLCEGNEADSFMRDHASAVLVPPFQLRMLRAAVRAVSKEYV